MRRTLMMLLTIIAAVMTSSCGANNGGEKTVPTRDIKTVMEAHVDDLMRIPGVTGVAIGELEDGTPCIQVYVAEKSDEIVKKIPKQLEGHPVDIIESGVIRPMGDDG
jgi:hypothetical protein